MEEINTAAETVNENKTENEPVPETAAAQETVNTTVPKTGTAAPSGTSSGPNLPLIIAAVVLCIAGLIFLFIKLGPETTGRIRDISLILFVLESIVTVTALVVLVMELARLLNFLKYEVQPLLTTTTKTVKKLSGTVSFLCENAVEPTVNAASKLSGIKNAAEGVLSLFKK